MTKGSAIFFSLVVLVAITLGGRGAGNLYRNGTLSQARDPIAVMGLSMPDALSMLKPDAATGVLATTSENMLKGWTFNPAAPAEPMRVALLDSHAFSAGEADAVWPDPAAAVATGASPVSAFKVVLAHCHHGAPLQAIALTQDARYAVLPFGATANL